MVVKALGKALGPAAGGLIGFGEYATAREEGDSQARALTRAGVEAATGSIQWAAQPFSQAGARLQGSLLNPMQTADVVRSWGGDTAAGQRVSDRLATTKAQSQLTQDFYSSFSGNVVNAVAPKGASTPSTTGPPVSQAGVPTVGIAAGVGGLAIAAGGFALTRGKSMNAAKVGKGAQGVKKAAQAVAASPKVQQVAGQAQNAAKAAKGSKIGQAIAGSKFAKDFNSTFASKWTPGHLTGEILKTSTIGVIATSAAVALHLKRPSAAPPPPAAAPVGPVTGFTTKADAMYGLSQPKWWDQVFFGGRINEAMGTKGFAWSQLEQQGQQAQMQDATTRRGQDVQQQIAKEVAWTGLAGQKYMADQEFASEKYSADQRFAGIKDTNRTNLSISDYESGRRLQGQMYEADQQLVGQKYVSNNQLVGQKYTSDNQLTGQKYVADSNLAGERIKAGAQMYGDKARLQGTMYTADAQVKGTQIKASADMYGADRQMQGTMYSADQKLRGDVYRARTDLAIADVSSGRKLAGEMYTADSQLKGVDLTSARKLQGEQYRANTDFAIADVTTGRKLQGEQYKANTDFAIADVTTGRKLQGDMFTAAEQGRTQRYASDNDFRGKAAAASATVTAAQINSAASVTAEKIRAASQQNIAKIQAANAINIENLQGQTSRYNTKISQEGAIAKTREENVGKFMTSAADARAKASAVWWDKMIYGGK